MLKDKVYWFTMPIFLLITIAVFSYLPEEYKLYSSLIVVLFWILYLPYYFTKKKKEIN